MSHSLIEQEHAGVYSKDVHHSIVKYFFISICSIEVAFILWHFVISPARNSGTFLITFVIILFISLPLGLGLALNIFRNRDGSFFFTFGLCIGYGLIASVWALMIRAGCPLNPYIYIGVVFTIAGSLLFRKWRVLKGFFERNACQFRLTRLLPPIAVLLFAFIVLSATWSNSYVLTDVDCQSDGYNTLMILKEGKYPFVNPFLDQSCLQLNSGPIFHILIAVVSKLKSSVLIPEIMAITVISGAFFCMAIYFLASFIIQNEIVLFFAGILTLTRAYLSFFNDGNLPENIAFYFAAVFMVFLMHAMESKRRVFAVFSGIYLSFCMLSHPNIFIYHLPPFVLFFATFLVSRNKDLKKDYINLFITLGIILIPIFPYVLRLQESYPSKLYENDATTVLSSLPYWNGYVVLILVLGGIILIATKRKVINVYLWTCLLAVLFFVEYWRIYQILSPSWFELKPMAVPSFGAYYTYKSFLQNPANYISSWQAGVIIWPIAIAVVIDHLFHLFGRYIKIRLLQNFAIFSIVCLTFFFISYEYKKTKRYPEFITKSDYNALVWMRENTRYQNTFIYAPFDEAKENSVPSWVTSFWVSVVSERKSLPFRNYYMDVQFKFLNLDKPITEKVNQLQKATYSIIDPESYKTLRGMKITHIFISAFLSEKLFGTYQKSSFVELVHYDSVPNQGTALIYRVK
ncbi:MAG: hypothetical protein A2Y09_10300 [Planctomycetes bacterium GWA2_39_15]|nr:MAG: hypothetical protein A2Y09_10300 [Planctomycetes bacterium GWA2_39_15]